jgi:predicted TIM-barrel fold metal-dependent hydrolase
MAPDWGTRLKVVDPHLHFWDTDQVSYPWLDNRTLAFSGDNRLLPVPYDVAAFLRDAADVDVLMSVHVEANPASSIAEAQWLQRLADDPGNRGHPHGIVAYADLSRADAPELLDDLAAYSNLRGIRQILNIHEDPRFEYVRRNFLMEPLWRQNLRRLARYKWSFDLQLYPAQVPQALQVIDLNPDITFIVNHAGMFVDRERFDGWRQWRDGIRALAERANVAIKLSGLAMFDHQWSQESFRPYVLESIDAFGPQRCMFASNFPIDRLHAQYGPLWRTYEAIVAGAPEAQRAALLADNAIRYYRLQPRP